MQGDENLICDLPELFPQKNLPANYKFVEPLIYHDPAPDNTWLARIDPAKPVIFVCMGSTGDWEKLKFLNDAQYSAFNIISAGDRSTVLTATHIISRPFVNLSSVLAISSLMICHGGNGTIYHGLLAGVPMLCLTSHFEQEWNVKALEKLGYGISADDFSEEQWWEHIRMTALRKMTPYFKQKSAENATELTEHAARSRPLF